MIGIKQSRATIGSAGQRKYTVHTEELEQTIDTLKGKLESQRRGINRVVLGFTLVLLVFSTETVFSHLGIQQTQLTPSHPPFLALEFFFPCAFLLVATALFSEYIKTKIAFRKKKEQLSVQGR